MLTKEERAAIAERLRGTYYITNSTLFKALTGEEELIENDQVKELCVIGRVIFDLCDTSNLIELPLDKDGEVIRVGDVVYGEDGLRHEVYQIVFDGDAKWLVLARDGELSVGTYSSPISFTHKQPVTAKSLAQRIRDVLRNDHSEMSPYTSRELVHIANDLERLGDNNE